MSTDTRVLERRHFDAGDVVIREGDESNEAYMIRNGSAHVLKHSDRGGDVVIGSLGPGSIFGEMGLIQDRPRAATVRAATALDVEVVTAQTFNRIFSQEGAAELRPILIALFERLRTADSRLAELGHQQPSTSSGTSAEGESNEFVVTLVARSPRAQDAMGRTQIEALPKFPFLVGRAADEGGAEGGGVLHANDLFLQDERPYSVSRSHFAICRQGNTCVFQDRGSRLGTLVNGVRVGGSPRHPSAVRLKRGENTVVLGSRRADLSFAVLVKAPAEGGMWSSVRNALFG